MSARMYATLRQRRRADTGSRSPVSVLLLHGMGGGVSTWDALASRLAPHLELWDVKLPWAFTGNPDWAREPDVTQWISTAVDSLRRETGSGPDVIVAHSFAANVVLEILAEAELLASTPALLISPFYRDLGVDLDWTSVMSSMEQCYTTVGNDIQEKGSCESDLLRNAITNRIRKLTGPYPRLRFHQLYYRTPHLALESLNVPVFLVSGSDDEGATAEGVRMLADRIPDARLEILDGCGHFPMIERVSQLAEAIESFVDQVVQPSSAT